MVYIFTKSLSSVLNLILKSGMCTLGIISTFELIIWFIVSISNTKSSFGEFIYSCNWVFDAQRMVSISFRSSTSSLIFFSCFFFWESNFWRARFWAFLRIWSSFLKCLLMLSLTLFLIVVFYAFDYFTETFELEKVLV